MGPGVTNPMGRALRTFAARASSQETPSPWLQHPGAGTRHRSRHRYPSTALPRGARAKQRQCLKGKEPKPSEWKGT